MESPPRYADDGHSYEETPVDNRQGANKMRVMSGGSGPSAPSSAPPKSLLEAAVGRPATQRGLDKPQGHGQQNQSSRQTNQSSGSNSRRYDFDPSEDDEMLNTTAIDIDPHGRGHYDGGQQYQSGPNPLSMDELV